MKIQNEPNPKTSTRPSTFAAHLASHSRAFGAMAAALLLGFTTVASFANDNPNIFPIGSRPDGKSYGQWTEAWWQWALGIPAANNPVIDTTGQFAGVGQSGPVWFLGSSLGSSVERTLTIPRGKAIFMPVYQWLFGATVGDCDPSNPGVPCDVPTLRASAAAPVLAVQSISVSIDGEQVRQIRNYRALSPDSFSITLPDGNLTGLPAGTYGPQVADGYWLMLEPLEPGKHTIRVNVNPDPAFGSSFQVIYHITVSGTRDDSNEQD